MQYTPVVELPWEPDVDALRRYYTENRYNGVDEFGADISAAVLDGAKYLEASPEEYWPLSITTLSEAAVAAQSALDAERGMTWQEHQKTLTARRRLRAMLKRNEDYDPAIDERNYTNLLESARGTYAEEVRTKFLGTPCRTRFTKLGKGEAIHQHVDSVPEHIVRAIIPVWSNSDCFNGFLRSGEPFELHMEVGKAYVINAGLPHWAYNHGNSDRLHYIVTLDGPEDLVQGTGREPINTLNRNALKP